VRQKTTVTAVLVWTATAIFLFPIFWIMFTSVKTPVQAFQIPPVWFFRPTLENYVTVFRSQPFGHYFWNSATTAATSTIFSLTVGTAAAYSLARFRFRAQKSISFVIFLTRMVPPVVLLVPFFILFRNLNWTDTPAALAFSYTAFNLPFVIWLMWGFFKEIPYELEQAAMIDGASAFGAMVRITLPLARPGLAAASIFALMNAWNEFLFALVLTGPNAKTLPVGAAQFVTQDAILWGPVMAAGTMIMLPLILFTVLIQKHLVRGLTMGAIK